MDIHGYPWRSIDIHGYQWISMDIHGDPWRSMEVHADPWRSMEIHGDPSMSMEIHGYPWISISMDTNEYPWISMRNSVFVKFWDALPHPGIPNNQLAGYIWWSESCTTRRGDTRPQCTAPEHAYAARAMPLEHGLPIAWISGLLVASPLAQALRFHDNNC